MSCNGWKGYATCGRCPATDGEATQLAGVKLQWMERLRYLREMSCNGWQFPAYRGISNVIVYALKWDDK
ncbi:MAG: hypothetical protein JZU53_04035 [Paludibacter sp.]|nr:hypothetical protein [Paludibacter sp.]